ncbi:MAG TPA: RHS repeat-associated core domain-containing protein, partial [Terriglobales bacterium]
MKFTGHERDLSLVSTGELLDYMHARYYSSSESRFGGPDAVPGIPSQPQGWNRYTYVMNSPPNRIDPLGLFDCPPNDPSCITVYGPGVYGPLTRHQQEVREWEQLNRDLDRERLRERAEVKRDQRELLQQQEEHARIAKCYNDHKFSSLFPEGALSNAVEFAEAGAGNSFAGDVAATAMKATFAGTGGPKAAYASGMNFLFRRVGQTFGALTGNYKLTRSLTNFGNKASPVLAVFFVATFSYNVSTFVQCQASVLE